MGLAEQFLADAAAGSKLPAPSASAASAPSLAQQFVLDAQAGAQQRPEPQAQPSRGVASEIGRQLGLTARAGVQGVAAIPAILADGVGGLYNVSADAADKLFGMEPGRRFYPSAPELGRLLTKMGLPEPGNATERIAQDVGSAMTGTGVLNSVGQIGMKAANPIVQAVSSSFASKPLLSTVSAATGGAAGGGAREAGFGPAGQLVAALLGGMSPIALREGSAWALGRALRGNATPASMVQNLEAFGSAGATPTVGQLTESGPARWLESTLAKVPGGAGPIAARAEDTATKVSAKVGQLADDLAPNADATAAGRAIQQGVKGDDAKSFLNLFKAQQGKLYEKLDQHFPAKAAVDVTNTRAALAALNQDIEGAKALSQWFKNARIQGIEGALKQDLKGPAPGVMVSTEGGGGMTNAAVTKSTPIPGGTDSTSLPFEAIKKLRTLVGNEITDSGLASDVPRSKWKTLYNALTSDLGAAAEKAGPPALKAWKRANDFTSAGLDRLDLMSGVVNQAIPEKVFNAAVSGTREGATMLNAVMKSVPPESQRTVTATFLKKMGQALPNAQNAEGDAFSLNTFLTNWNKTSPQAKTALFSRAGYPADFVSDLDKLSRIAGNLREGSKVLANPSGTGSAVANAGVLGTALGALMSGNYKTAAGIAATAGGANLMSRFMTSPNAVKWMVQLGSQPSAALPQAINQFAQQAAKTGTDEDKALVRDLARQVAQERQPARASIEDAFRAAGF